MARWEAYPHLDTRGEVRGAPENNVPGRVHDIFAAAKIRLLPRALTALSPQALLIRCSPPLECLYLHANHYRYYDRALVGLLHEVLHYLCGYLGLNLVGVYGVGLLGDALGSLLDDEARLLEEFL